MRGLAGLGNAWQGKGSNQSTRGADVFDLKGDRAQWCTIYEHISGMAIGETITHDELAALLPDAPEGSVRGAFHRAVRECETANHRTFSNVRGVGYRMVDAAEHERLARDHHKRAKRQLKSSRRKVVSADRSRLTREERARFDAIELNLSRHIEMTNRRLDTVEARLEQARAEVRATRRDQKTTAADLAHRVDNLAALLEKHGITDKQAAS